MSAYKSYAYDKWHARCHLIRDNVIVCHVVVKFYNLSAAIMKSAVEYIISICMKTESNQEILTFFKWENSNTLKI